MSTWKYLKGTAEDFEGLGDKVRAILKSKNGTIHGAHDSAQWVNDPDYRLVALRERVTSVNDDRLAQSLRVGSGVHSNDVITERRSKYHREIKPGVWVDVYDVLVAWSVTNPALQHLIKKALQPGERGHKDVEQDLQDILHSAKRAIELNEVKK